MQIWSSSTAATRAGYVLSGLFVLFMLFDSAIKLVPIAAVPETMAQLGYSTDVGLARFLGILSIICTLLYVFPKTAVLGAVLLTGYLGGAMASQLRVGSPLFTHLFFGLYLGLFMWGGLWLRDARLRALAPWRTDRD